MDKHTLFLFAMTVLPLICAPGPDMLFIVSQAISGDASAGLRSTSGVCTGYVIHSLLVAFGLAAVIAASPLLFEALRWVGVGYLVYLALQLLKSAMKPKTIRLAHQPAPSPFRKGFLTAVLNPKGMMIYFAILPQFMRHDQTATQQAFVLSAVFIGLCGAIYSVISVVSATAGRRAGGLSDRRRRCIEGLSGGVLMAAAAKLAKS